MMKVQIISERHKLPWSIDSEKEIKGILLPGFNNLLLIIKEINGSSQLLFFPEYKPAQNKEFDVIETFDIPDDVGETLFDLFQRISSWTELFKLHIQGHI